MPVGHLILRAYGTWMPDRDEGFWRRRVGPQDPNPGLARAYRDRQSEPSAEFGPDEQAAIVAASRETAQCVDVILYRVATDRHHGHLLLGWDDDRDPARLRASFKSAVTRALNAIRRRPWLGRGGRIEVVRTRSHFEHLYFEYLPSHPGVGWAMKWRGAEPPAC